MSTTKWTECRAGTVNGAYQRFMVFLGEDAEQVLTLMNTNDEIAQDVAGYARNRVLGQSQNMASPNDFAGEEVKSNYVYPPEHKGLKSVADQVKILLEFLPGLDPALALQYAAEVYSRLTLPSWIEGPLVVPKLSTMARLFFHNLKGVAEQNCAAVNLILEKIAVQRSFYNYRSGQILPDRYCQHTRTAAALQVLEASQPGDLLVIPVQLGLHHRGRSTRRATAVMLEPEFGLGAFAGGCATLTHSERFVRWEQLHMDLPGDEFAPDAGGQFSRAPILGHDGGRLEFGAYDVGGADARYGSASGLVPQPSDPRN